MRSQRNEDVKKIVMLVAKLNQYCYEYYNKAKPSVSVQSMSIVLMSCRSRRKRRGF